MFTIYQLGQDLFHPQYYGYNGDVMAISYEDMNQESWDVMENRQGV
jgi:hypothetical protein